MSHVPWVLRMRRVRSVHPWDVLSTVARLAGGEARDMVEGQQAIRCGHGHRRPLLSFGMSFVEVEIMRLGLDRASNSYVVILREKEGERILPIWIGQAEAESIVIEMHKMQRERPLTHDLCKHLITQLGATLRHVHITRVVSRTYYAELHLASRDGSVVVDARPSDSIAIALRFGAPMLAHDTLLTSAVVEEEESTGDAEPPFAPPMTPEELKAYLENMRPEDFGKFHF